MSANELTGWRYYWRLLLRGGEGGLVSWSKDPDFPECPDCHGPNAVVQFSLLGYPCWLCLDCRATGTVPGWPKGRRRNNDRSPGTSRGGGDIATQAALKGNGSDNPFIRWLTPKPLLVKDNAPGAGEHT